MFVSRLVTVAASLSVLASAVPTRRADGGKLVIYWGAEDDSTTLNDVCNDPSYDVVVLAFLDRYFADGGYPGISISGLEGPSQAQSDAGATSLQDGTPLNSAIQSCQSQDKPVLLSMGGGASTATIDSDEQGEQLAHTLWNLFLGGTDEAELRPFGDVNIDGFDVDNETHNPTGWAKMVSTLRQLMNSDSSKKYYLSAAPQCPYPDESIPLDVCTQLDYVYVQFYNNGNCNIAQDGFLDAVQRWSDGIGDAKLFIGALASGSDGDQGYVDVDTLVQAIQNVKDLNLPNYAGAMLWEAQLAVQNDNFQQAIKAGV